MDGTQRGLRSGEQGWVFRVREKGRLKHSPEAKLPLSIKMLACSHFKFYFPCPNYGT